MPPPSSVSRTSRLGEVAIHDRFKRAIAGDLLLDADPATLAALWSRSTSACLCKLRVELVARNAYRWFKWPCMPCCKRTTFSALLNSGRVRGLIALPYALALRRRGGQKCRLVELTVVHTEDRFGGSTASNDKAFGDTAQSRVEWTEG